MNNKISKSPHSLMDDFCAQASPGAVYVFARR